MAKFGSSSIARLWNVRAAAKSPAAQPRLYAFSASSEGVVASASGRSNFFTVARDSPSSPRNLDADFSFGAEIVHGVIQEKRDADDERSGADFIQPICAEALFHVGPIASWLNK